VTAFNPSLQFTDDHYCSGYTDPVFEGKAEQASQVKAMLKERGFIPPDLAEGEVDWFYQCVEME
jgi:hypothetical protein